MLWGYAGAEKLPELLHSKRASLQTRTRLMAVCFGSSYLLDSPREQLQKQRTTGRPAADQRRAVILKPSLTHRQFMFMEYGAGDILKPKHLSSYADPGQT